MVALEDESTPPTRLSHAVLDVRRGRKGRYWTRLDSDIVIVSNVSITSKIPFGIIVPLTDDWSIRQIAAERLYAVWSGRTPRGWFTIQRRKRIGAALRTDDARQSGAHLRDIAITYFGARRVAAEPWKTSALKAQVARLAVYGHALVMDGYRQLLHGKTASYSRRS